MQTHIQCQWKPFITYAQASYLLRNLNAFCALVILCNSHNYTTRVNIWNLCNITGCNLCYTQDNCRLTYRASGSLGWYAVALQVEDFINASSTVAMSSVPVQFLVMVQNIAVTPDLTPPTFVGTTPEDRACIIVENTYRQQITARSGSENATWACAV